MTTPAPRRFRVVGRRTSSGGIHYAVRAEPLDGAACEHHWLLFERRWPTKAAAQAWVDGVVVAQMALLAGDAVDDGHRVAAVMPLRRIG